jgi:SPP1 family phage portal protein
LALVDVLDKGVSEDLANELQRLANSYLLLANDIDGVTEDGNGETEVDKIKRTKVIANLREDVRRSVDFLTKNLDPSFINSALDRLERLIYELIGIPNPSDDTFAASSGIALAYKLIPLEYLATVIETYFTRGLQNRIRLISDGQYTMTGNESKNEVQISWMRNLPNDLITLTQVAMNVKGILSDETILRMFPSSIVSDVEEEMQKIVEQSDTIDIETVEPETTEETNGESGLS